MASIIDNWYWIVGLAFGLFVTIVVYIRFVWKSKTKISAKDSSIAAGRDVTISQNDKKGRRKK